MNADLDALATEPYVSVDDFLIINPHLVPARPEIGIAPQLSDAELITMAMLQALLGFHNEARWIRYAQLHLTGLFPYVPDRPGYNKRLRAATSMMSAVIRMLATQCSSWNDDLWLIDSTPVECGRSRETAKRSELVGWAGYGYCASHSRYFWGLRLHLVATPSGLPVAFALSNPKIDEREIARNLFEIDEALLAERQGQTLMADKGYRSKEFDFAMADLGIELIRPSVKGESPRSGHRFLKNFRQIIESVNQTLKGQLDLERHGARTPSGVVARVLQRLLALTAAIWHNETAGKPILRSLIAFDH